MAHLRRDVGQERGHRQWWWATSVLLLGVLAVGGIPTAEAQDLSDDDPPVVEMLGPREFEWATTRTVAILFRVADASPIDEATIELRNRFGRAYDGTEWVSIRRERAPKLDAIPQGDGIYGLTLPDALFDDPNQSYLARVVVRDAAGNAQVVTTDFFGVRDPEAPAPMLVESPLPRVGNPADAPLRVEVAPDSGIARVTYRFAGQWPPVDVPRLGATTFGQPLSLSADDGQYRLDVIGYSADGTRLAFVRYRFRGPDAPTTPQTDFEPPTTSIVGPLDGSVAESLSVPIEFTIEDESVMASVRYLVQRKRDGYFLQPDGADFGPGFARVEARRLGDNSYGGSVRTEYSEQYRVQVTATDIWGNQTEREDRAEVTFTAVGDLDAPNPEIIIAELDDGRLRLVTYSEDPQRTRRGYPIRVLYWIRDPETGHYLTSEAGGVFEEGFRTIATGAIAEFELPPGEYQARVIAIDPAGNRGMSEPFDIRFDPDVSDPEPIVEIGARQERPTLDPHVRMWFPSPYVDGAYTLPLTPSVRYWLQDVETGLYLKWRKTWLPEPYPNPSRTHSRYGFRSRQVSLEPGDYRVGVAWTDSLGASRDAEYLVTFTDGQIVGNAPSG